MMAAAPSDGDEIPKCPMCNFTAEDEAELQMHYLQSCSSYERAVNPLHVPSEFPPGVSAGIGSNQFGTEGVRDVRQPVPTDVQPVLMGNVTDTGGSGGDQVMTQHLVKFVWYPNDPYGKSYKDTNKAILLSSFSAGNGSVEMFVIKDNDLISFASSSVSVREGKYDGQIVCGEEMLEVDPFEISGGGTDEVFLITKSVEEDRPGEDLYKQQPAVYEQQRVPPSGAEVGVHSSSAHSDNPAYAKNSFNDSSNPQQTGYTSNYGSTPAHTQHTPSPQGAGVFNQFSPTRPVAGGVAAIPSSGDIATLKNWGSGSSGEGYDESAATTATVMGHSPSAHFGGSVQRVNIPSTTGHGEVAPTPQWSPPSAAVVSKYSPYAGRDVVQSAANDRRVGGSGAERSAQNPLTDFAGGSSTQAVGRKEDSEFVPRKSGGINLQQFGASGGAEEEGRTVQRLQRELDKKEEMARSMERSNTALNSRIHRLETQLSNIGGAGANSDAAIVDENRKLNARVSELENFEHMHKNNASNVTDVEMYYQQQIQELEQKNAELSEHLKNLEAICAMQQGEALAESRKEIERNRQVISQLEASLQQMSSRMETSFQQQTNQMEEHKAALSRTVELTEENAKLHEQNFNLAEDLKSATTRIPQQGNDDSHSFEELNALKLDNAKLAKLLQQQVENAERDQEMLEQKNYAVAGELQRLRALHSAAGSAADGTGEELDHLKEENHQFSNTINTLQMQNASYQAGHKEIQQGMAALQQEVSTLQSTNDQLQQNVHTLEQEKALAEAKMQQLQEIAGQGTESEASALKEQLSATVVAQHESEKELAEMKQRFADLTREKEQLLMERSGVSHDQETRINQQVEQLQQDRDGFRQQLASVQENKDFLEHEMAEQNQLMSALQSQIAAEKVSTQQKLEEVMQKAAQDSGAKGAQINDMQTRMLALQQTRGQLENDMAIMREQQEKLHTENAQLREVATQPSKYQQAIEKSKQLMKDNEELGNALEISKADMELCKENITLLKDQLDKVADHTTLEAITDRMSKYKNERDVARAQVHELNGQLQEAPQGGSEELVIKMSRYREERNEARKMNEVLDSKCKELNAIIAQMASSQLMRPAMDRQISEEDSFNPSVDDSFVNLSTTGTRKSSGGISSSPLPSDKAASKPKASPSLLKPKSSPSTKSPLSGSSTHTATKQKSTPKKQSSLPANAKSVQVTTATGTEPVACVPVKSATELQVGDRIVVHRQDCDQLGTVKARDVVIGGTHLVGIELDLPRGISDGSVKGIRYFHCKPKYGLCTPLKNIQKCV